MLEQRYKDKLGKQILLFSSDQDGEVLAAVAAGTRTLTKNEQTWHDVVEALNGKKGTYERGFNDGFREGYERSAEQAEQRGELDHRVMLARLRGAKGLNAWSKDFVANLTSNRHWRLTDKQKVVIERLHSQFYRRN